MSSDTISLHDAAMALGMSRERALRLLLRGRLAGSKVDGLYRISRESVEAELLRRGAGAPLDPAPAR